MNESASGPLTSKMLDLDGSSQHSRTSGSMMGDWLLTFGEPVCQPVRRTQAAPWAAVLSAGSGTLWRTESTDDWRGTPTLEVDHGTWRAWLVGELYDAPAPRQTIRAVLDGRQSANALNGHFMLLACDRDSGEWHIWTNRHATLHAYRGQNGSRSALGTFFPAVAAAAGCKELDWLGLTTFFDFGFFAADRTHLFGVRILRPATHLHFNPDGQLLAEAAYWQWWHAPDTRRTYDQTVDEFADRFGTVMNDLTGSGRIAVPISGGLDSRTTVAALASHKGSPRLWSFSYGYSDDSVETAIAGQIARARNLDFDAYTIEPYLFSQLVHINAAVEGFEDVTQCRQAAFRNEIDHHADYLIAAHLGDLYLDDMGQVSVKTMSAADLMSVTWKKVHKGGSEWLIDHLCRPNLGADSPEIILHNALAGELSRLETITEPDFRIKAFKVDQWCARWTTVALRMYQASAYPRLPFYDTRLADFFCTVPTEMLSGRRLQIDYLRRYAPDLARVKWQVTGHDLFHERRSGFVDFASRAAVRGLRKLRRQPHWERNWEIQFAGQAGKQGLHDWLLQPGLSLHDYVSPQEIGDLLAAFARDPYREQRSYSVAMLLSFSVWLETHYRDVVRQP